MTAQTRYEFALRPSLDLRLERIGNEREPALVVEGMLSDPSELIDYAAREVAFAPADGPAGGYPGIRAPAPLNYVERVSRALSPSIQRAFGLKDVKLARAQCSLSIVTRAAAELAPLQRIPHTDTADPLQFAILHYLCGPEHGGTAFYRHRETGFETLSEDRWPIYQQIREREIGEISSDGYIVGDSEHYQQIAKFDAAFDRVLIYRSCLLHSGVIPQSAALDPDPRSGRLTANIFLNYGQKPRGA